MPGVLRHKLPLIGVSFAMFLFHWNTNSLFVMFGKQPANFI